MLKHTNLASGNCFNECDIRYGAYISVYGRRIQRQ